MYITFGSSIRDMTHDYFLKQPKSMCELKLNKMSLENPRHIYCLNRHSNHLLIRKYSNQKTLSYHLYEMKSVSPLSITQRSKIDTIFYYHK